MQAVVDYRKTVYKYTTRVTLAWLAHTCSCDGTRDAEPLFKTALTANANYSVRTVRPVVSLDFSQLETFRHV